MNVDSIDWFYVFILQTLTPVWVVCRNESRVLKQFFLDLLGRCFGCKPVLLLEVLRCCGPYTMAIAIFETFCRFITTTESLLNSILFRSLLHLRLVQAYDHIWNNFPKQDFLNSSFALHFNLVTFFTFICVKPFNSGVVLCILLLLSLKRHNYCIFMIDRIVFVCIFKILTSLVCFSLKSCIIWSLKIHNTH